MTNKTSFKKLYLPVILFFIIINGSLVFFSPRLEKVNFNASVVLAGNLILFAATVFSLFLYQRALGHSSTHGFLRNAYSGLIAKLVVCLIAVGAYAMAAGSAINKQGILSCVVLYVIYSVIEMRSLMRWNKERTNA